MLKTPASATSPVKCSLCPRHCRIPENSRGDCRVRANQDGKVISLVYGKPCAVHVDPVEKKPFYHLLPGSMAFSIATAGCNLHCRYCQNSALSQNSPETVGHIDLPPEKVVQGALDTSCRSIAYTYSDPVISYEYTRDISILAREKNLLNLLVTAGYIERMPLLELCKVIHGANVDLKGISDAFYRKMSRATLKPVLDTIVTLKEKDIWVEITHLIVPTWNDAEEDTRKLVRWVKNNCGADTPLHFSRFYPMHELRDLPATPEATLIRAAKIAREEGLHYIYTGNMPTDGQTDTLCPSCHHVLIERRGYAIKSNTLKDGKCPDCNALIPGKWL